MQFKKKKIYKYYIHLKKCLFNFKIYLKIHFNFHSLF
jgi:hypothetical protein